MTDKKTNQEDEQLQVLQEAGEAMDATWSEVFATCCVRTPAEWGQVFLGLLVVMFFLYFFLVGLELLGNGAKVMTACRAGTLFGDDTNPVGGLMVGILVTVLLQSSSTTTSIVVSLVGANTVTVDQGIFMIMGANIGTSVTNTIIAMGQMGNGDNLERAFAGATVHDLFNFLTAGVLLPVEAATGYLNALTKAMVKNAEPEDGEEWETPLERIVDPLVKMIIDDNGDVVKAVAKGGSCDDFFPINCTDRVVSDETCSQGLIGCNGDTNECPIFFNQDATRADEVVAGAVCFILAIIILFICLGGLIFTLQKMLMNVSTKILYKATDVNPVLSIIIGAGITMFVQSSSITTSVLTPLVGAGVLRLENMLPLTLGANIGTTMTALLASLVSSSIDSLQVALAHLFFNITGIIIWYPIPFMRNIPLGGSRRLGQLTRVWRGFPILYIAVCFFLIPLFFFGLSALYMGAEGLVALAVMITLVVAAGIAYTIYWCRYRDGREKTLEAFQERQRRREAFQTLPDNMDSLNGEVSELKRKIEMLVAHTGLPEDNDEEQQNLLADKKSEDRSSTYEENSDEQNVEVET